MKEFTDPEYIRRIKLTGAIMTRRLACMQPADEAIFIEYYGEEGSRAFWRSYLFGIDSLPMFIYTLSRTAAENIDRVDVFEMTLGAAMVEAYQSDRDFFRGGVDQMKGVSYYREIAEPRAVKVITRDAASWLLNNPMRRHLVPASLTAFLTTDSKREEQTPKLNQVAPAKKRGRKPSVLPRVCAAMLGDLNAGKTTVDQLKNDTEETLSAAYGASRDTCRKAMAAALSQFVVK